MSTSKTPGDHLLLDILLESDSFYAIPFNRRCSINSITYCVPTAKARMVHLSASIRINEDRSVPVGWHPRCRHKATYSGRRHAVPREMLYVTKIIASCCEDTDSLQLVLRSPIASNVCA